MTEKTGIIETNETMINVSLCVWCAVVVIEMAIISWLLGSYWWMLLCLVLIPPIMAAFKWPILLKRIEIKTTDVTQITKTTVEVKA